MSVEADEEATGPATLVFLDPDFRTIMSQTGPQYEFSSEDNEAIGRLAHRMRSVGSWFEVYGAFLVLQFFVRWFYAEEPLAAAPVDLISGALLLFLGFRTRRSAHAFRGIVLTEGSDIAHLRKALSELASYYRLIDRVIFAVLLLAVLVGAGFFLSVAR